jgi:hypothetical protein
MKAATRNNIFAMLGLLLSIPTTWFILISIMKYGFGWNYLFNVTWPVLERWGIKESLGWNINLLIVFGPVLALLSNALLIVKLTIWVTNEAIDCRIAITKSWQNMLLVVFSGGLMLILLAYMIGEDCHGCE